MSYDIYFHHDLDGIASAALILNFLRSRGDSIENYFPLSYSPGLDWAARKFKNPAIVVDFQYHPKAAIWFDHHATTFEKKRWKENFHRDKFHEWRPNYPSCLRIVLNALKRHFRFNPPQHLKELARWTDIVDQAKFKSARQTIELKEPALQLNAFIDHGISYSDTKWLIEFLSKHHFRRVMAMPRVKRAIKIIRREISESLKFYKKNTRLFGRVALADLSKVRKLELRFAPYYLHPRILYSISLKKRAKAFHLNLGINPWRKRENKIHIGRLLKRFGGGGHRVVGGAEFKTRKEALSAVKQILDILSRKS